jgi:hypothetical protein
MIDFTDLFGSENVIPILFIAPISILWGAFLLWAAWTDAGSFFSSWYEENKDSRIGFWAVSGSSGGFRGWHVVAGTCFVIGGVAGFVWAL